MTVHDTAGEIDEIIRNGGEFWIVEVSGDNGELRVWLRNTDQVSIKMELAAERMRRPNLTWTPKKVTVVTEVEEP
jgi:hypothetical protein